MSEMSMEDKLKLIADTIDAEVSALQPDVVLEDLEDWDSMDTLGIIAMLDQTFGVSLQADQIVKLKTVGDILEHMQGE